MTLLLGMSNPEGIYLCTDHRITDLRTKRSLYEDATKAIEVNYGMGFGPTTKAIFAFTGMAEVSRSRVRMSEWLREKLTKGPPVFEYVPDYLLTQLNHDIAKYVQPLVINMMAIGPDPTQRRFAEFTNIVLSTGKVGASFTGRGNTVRPDYLFANGGGFPDAIATERIQKAKRLLGTRPRKPEDYMRLLSTVVRQVAANNHTVGSRSTVHFVSSAEGFTSTIRSFTGRSSAPSIDMPFVCPGLDIGKMAQWTSAHAAATREGREPPPIPAEFDTGERKFLGWNRNKSGTKVGIETTDPA
jgi:hypothetical protein